MKAIINATLILVFYGFPAYAFNWTGAGAGASAGIQGAQQYQTQQLQIEEMRLRNQMSRQQLQDANQPFPQGQQERGEQRILVAEEVKAVIDRCEKRYRAGTIKTHVAKVKCSNQRILEIYTSAGSPNLDLVKLASTKRLDVAKEIDSKEVTEAEGQLELSEYIEKITEIGRQRNSNMDSVR